MQISADSSPAALKRPRPACRLGQECSPAYGILLRAELDALDWKILAELQADASLTNVELARRVGISPPPCLRRVRALEKAGLIRGYRARLAPERLGYAVTCFVFVHLASQAEPDLDAFAARIRALEPVRECWTLSGETDFMFKCVTVDLGSLQAIIRDLTAMPNVRNVRTALVLSTVKDDPDVPITPAGGAA